MNFTSLKEITKELFDFNKNLFTEKLHLSKDETLPFSNFILILQLTQKQCANCKFLPSGK